jgi:hypothetical protein
LCLKVKLVPEEEADIEEAEAPQRQCFEDPQLSSTLLKRAAAAVLAQQSDRFDGPYPRCPAMAHIPFPATSSFNGHCPSFFSSEPSSGSQSPDTAAPERKHIHFNAEVKQCIALRTGELYKVAGGGNVYDENSESDCGDDRILMKRINSTQNRPCTDQWGCQVVRKALSYCHPRLYDIAETLSSRMKSRWSVVLDSAMEANNLFGLITRLDH